MNPQDYYFGMQLSHSTIDFDDDGNEIITKGPATFYVVPKERWDSTGYLDDSVGRIVNPTLYSLGFHEQAEAMYEFNGPDEDGRKALINLGFEEKDIKFDY